MPQIIHLPPIRPQKQSGVDPKVQSRVLEFLDRFPDGPPDDFLDRITTDVMLSRFGYGSIEGRSVAVRALQALEKDGKVHIHYDQPKRKKAAPTVVQVRRITKEPPAATVPPAPIPLREWIRRTPVRRNVPEFAPGVARDRRRAKLEGDHNELRFHALMVRLIRVLPAAFSGILEAQAERSGQHNPRKGKVDLRDHRGDDVCLRFLVETQTKGSPKATRLIYDVKSSDFMTSRFNDSIRRIGSAQRKAALKRAITVNSRRTDRDVVGEVLDDIDRVGVISMAVRDSILDHFSE